jgi:hypothetical protein
VIPRYTRSVRCENCGYDNAGVRALVCPECGVQPAYIQAGFPRWVQRAATISAWSAWGVFAISMLVIVVALVGGGRDPGVVLLLACPGVQLAVAALTFVPWWQSVKRTRRFPTVPDCVFVGLLPWINAVLPLMIALGLVLP